MTSGPHHRGDATQGGGKGRRMQEELNEQVEEEVLVKRTEEDKRKEK